MMAEKRQVRAAEIRGTECDSTFDFHENNVALHQMDVASIRTNVIEQNFLVHSL